MNSNQSVSYRKNFIGIKSHSLQLPKHPKTTFENVDSLKIVLLVKHFKSRPFHGVTIIIFLNK